MKIRFFIRSGSKSSIHFEARYGVYYKFRVALGITLHSENDWIHARQRLKMPCATSNALAINQRLATLETKINAILIEEDDFERCVEKIEALFKASRPKNWTPKPVPANQNTEKDLIH